MKINPRTFPKQQSGVALAVSLIFLVLIAIIGVASLRGTTMNEMMASNAQQKSMVFQAAESAIAGVWDRDFVLAETPSILSNPGATTYTQDKNGEDFDNRLGYTTNTSAAIQYCAENALPVGYQLGAFVAHVYSVRGNSSIDSANTTAEHDQRGSIVGPPAGHTGNCP